MFALTEIKKMNETGRAAKAAKRARALNRPGGHAKDAEKGRNVVNPKWVNSPREKN